VCLVATATGYVSHTFSESNELAEMVFAPGSIDLKRGSASRGQIYEAIGNYPALLISTVELVSVLNNRLKHSDWLATTAVLKIREPLAVLSRLLPMERTVWAPMEDELSR